MEERQQKVCERIYELGMETVARAEKVANMEDKERIFTTVVGIIPKWKALCLELAGISEEDFSRFLDLKTPLKTHKS